MKFVYVWRTLIVLVAVALLLTVNRPLVDMLNNPKFSGEFTLIAIVWIVWPLLWAWAVASLIKRWLRKKKNETIA